MTIRDIARNTVKTLPGGTHPVNAVVEAIRIDAHLSGQEVTAVQARRALRDLPNVKRHTDRVRIRGRRVV